MSIVEPKPVLEAQDLLQAIDFVCDYFNRNYQEQALRSESHTALVDYYREQRERIGHHRATDDLHLRPRDQCWSCKARVPARQTFCPTCGAPVQDDRVDRLRYLVFLCFEIKKHEKEGRIPLSSAHAFLAESNERIAALRRKLERERAPLAQPVSAPSGKAPVVLELADQAPTEAPPSSPPAPSSARVPRRKREEAPAHRTKPAEPKRTILEILLDPRTIQWLLASGGALLALGLIIWLLAQGLFENKLFVAVLLGAGNALLLVGGWALMLGTRYQLAGRALTLLACLVMPLNLWFYDAQGLISLEEGGHLWIPALVCCVLYAVSARLLEDVMFVPVLVLGVAATGLLILADHRVNLFWEIASPAVWLVGLGVVCIHLERAFPESAGPFGRQRFGLAFFWSGHAVMVAGLLLLLGAQVFGHWVTGDDGPEIVRTSWGQMLALGLVLAASYAYLYSDLVVRRVGVYLHLAVFTLLWAEVLLINMGEWPIPTVEVVIFALAGTALVVNLLFAAAHDQKASLFRAGPTLALLLNAVPIVIGVVLHLRATSSLVVQGLREPLTGSYLAAMVATALSCRVGAYLYRHTRPVLSVLYFFGTMAATLLAAAGLLVVTWKDSHWENQAPMLMLIPLAYIVAARLYRGHTAEKPLVWVGHAATGLMLLFSAGTAFKGFAVIEQDTLNLLLCLFFAEAALFYGLAAGLHQQSGALYPCTLAACAAIWQLLKFWAVADEYYTLAFAAAGLLLLILYRLSMLDRYGGAGARAAFACGNGLLSLAFVAAALVTINELLANTGKKGTLVGLHSLLLAINILAVFVVRQQAWRRWYVVTTIFNAALVVLVLAVLTNLSAGEKLELICVTLGAGMLILAHIGWYREQEREDDLVTLGFVFGSLLLAIPLIAVVLITRIGLLVGTTATISTFQMLNEAGMFAAALVLITTGYLFRLRATTITGSIMAVLYLVTLLFYVRLPRGLQTTGVHLMIGGALFFGSGLLLSIYRDRLLTLPERIKRREGIFRILSWR